jgi:uncharacterized protein YggT (Ycf19 family)
MNPDPLQKLLLLQLGRIARWPLVVQLVLPFILITGWWALFHPLLVHIGVITHLRSNALLLAQGSVITVILYLTLKFLLLTFLIAHLIITYVYLGTNPLWEFINTTSRNFISPLNRLPLRLGKIDLAPIIGIILVVVFLYILPHQILAVLDRKHLTVWPQ